MKIATLFASAVLALSGLTGSADAGPFGGARYANEVVRARTTDVYHVRLRGGEMTTVSVVGNGRTDLDLHVYGELGFIITSDTDTSDRCLVMFYSPFDCMVTIKVSNLGYQSNRYTLHVK
jgi:hypothetical protein